MKMIAAPTSPDDAGGLWGSHCNRRKNQCDGASLSRLAIAFPLAFKWLSDNALTLPPPAFTRLSISRCVL